jgi:hypothetical protein
MHLWRASVTDISLRSGPRSILCNVGATLKDTPQLPIFMHAAILLEWGLVELEQRQAHKSQQDQRPAHLELHPYHIDYFGSCVACKREFGLRIDVYDTDTAISNASAE